MNKLAHIPGLESRIFDFNISAFDNLALEIFRFQYDNNKIYQLYCDTLGINITSVRTARQIPFLPIRFFKTHTVVCGDFKPEYIFESSGTTQTTNSKHLVRSSEVYTHSFRKTFELFYGNPQEYCIIGLLPSYLERQNSSLVVMVDDLIKKSGHPQSGFYLHNYAQLADTLRQLEASHQKTLLIGVTFALLDFAEAYPMPLHNTIIMETGGMKGRKEEMIRAEVHEVLKKAFQLSHIHSEYGMTELLSQAYSYKNGLFECPPWLRVILRSDDDPFDIITSPNLQQPVSGIINVIDLANLYSCSFIATDDAGKLYSNGNFEVLGRTDNSDIRGCSLMAL